MAPRRSTLTAEGFCGIGVIGANLRQVFFHSPWAGAYRSTVEQDQTLIEQMTPTPQKLRAGRSSVLEAALG